jgi:hypothetical protein
VSWVMSMKREEAPVRYRFFIGELQVAEVSFAGKKARLTVLGDPWLHVTDHDSMSEAMTEMHRRLKAPSPEGARVGGMKQ